MKGSDLTMMMLHTKRDDEGRFAVMIDGASNQPHLFTCETEAEAIAFMTAYKKGWIDGIQKTGGAEILIGERFPVPAIEWSIN